MANMANIASKTKDIYWGEFSETDLDAVLAFMRKGDLVAAKRYIDDDLGRSDFIFGKPRSDFMYYMNLDKNARCLDIGCGLGVHSFNFAPYVKEAVGFDQSAKRVEFCSLRSKLEKVSNVRFGHDSIMSFEDKVGNGAGGGSAGGGFDNIIMNGVLEWVPEARINKDPRQDQIDALKKLRTLLTDKGILYIGIENRFALNYLTSARDHNRLKYTTFMPRFLASWVTSIFRGKTYRTYTYSAFGYRKLLKDAGFDLSKVSIYIAHPGYNLPKYLVPLEDLTALRFFIGGLVGTSGFKGKVAGLISRSDLLLRMFKHGFYSYAIFARK